MTGFLGTPTMADIERLERRIEALEKAARNSSTDLVRQDNSPVKAKRAKRLHEHWTPEQETIDRMAAELNVSVDTLGREHMRFIDYWIAQPGQKGVKANWDSTWRNWMRTAHERGQLGVVGRTVADKARGWLELNVDAEG